MLPPVLRAYIRENHDRLIREAANTSATRRNQSAESPTAQAAKQARRKLDYAQLINAWFQSMPPAARQRRYQMEEFLVRFPGRYRDRSDPKVIGATLRKLGWSEHRDWTRAGRNRRYWMPPEK